MSLRRLFASFCLIFLSVISIPGAVLWSFFGRFLQFKPSKEIFPPRTDNDLSDDDEDMNENSNSTISLTYNLSKDLENPQERILIEADATVDTNRTTKINDNVVSVKPADEVNKEDEGQIIFPQEENEEERRLEESHLTSIQLQSLNLEKHNNLPDAIVKADVDEQAKPEHSGHLKPTIPASIVNQDVKQKDSGDSEHSVVSSTTSVNDKMNHKKRSKGASTEEAAKKKKTSKQKQTTKSTRYGAGIENHSNSCYLDSTLFSMLYKEDVFDGRLLNGEEAKETRDKTSEDVTNHLIKIAHSLRQKGYCPSNYVTNLRKSMRHINERLMSSMMDVDEFLANLLGKALHLNPFVMYCTKQGIRTGNFYHQVLINPNIQREKLGTLQDLLEESMKMQQLTFDEPPKPALIIKMPRSNGRLVGHQQIIPNLELDISKMLKDSCDEGNHVYELRAVITLYTLHYTAYVRRSSAANGEITENWEYFNDLPPTIREVDSLDSLLTSFSGNEFNSDFNKITQDIHVCIYNPSPPQKSDELASEGLACHSGEEQGVKQVEKEEDDISRTTNLESS